MKYTTDNLRIRGRTEVIAPNGLKEEFPVSEEASELIFNTRTAIHKVLHGLDDRLVVIVGPCSVHDPIAALQYARQLKVLRDALSQELILVMRVYFEKPRTTVGWKGFINDPDLDNSFKINKGLHLARNLLSDINNLGVPAATEYLDLISPQYVADLISWGAIGARTTESQVHRELASGLSCPVGFKNGTDGNLNIAIDAIRSASQPHHFLSLTGEGHSAIFSTTGNDDCHIILRGGTEPNYEAPYVASATAQLAKAGLRKNIMVDCSHANSRKDYSRQIEVGQNIADQIAIGNRDIMGLMLESHLNAGRQDTLKDQPLAFGVSITDACICWEDTIPLLHALAQAQRSRRALLA